MFFLSVGVSQRLNIFEQRACLADARNGMRKLALLPLAGAFQPLLAPSDRRGDGPAVLIALLLSLVELF